MDTHTHRPGELEWDPNADTTSLGALDRAFKGALEKPRYFRSMVQWSAVWNRYTPVAVAMEQLTWPQACLIWIKCFHWQRRNVFLVIVRQWCSWYDDLLRKSVANRAEWNDKSLDLAVVCGERDKQILEAARISLLRTRMCRNSSGSNYLPACANDRRKEAAEAERTVSRSGQSTKELVKQQAQLEASMKAMSASKSKGKSKEENKGKTNKQLKAEKFFDKQRTQTANKKWTSGASANAS